MRSGRKKEKESMLIEEICQWISSPAGTKKIQKGIQETQTLIADLRKVQAVDSKVLHRAITL